MGLEEKQEAVIHKLCEGKSDAGPLSELLRSHFAIAKAMWRVAVQKAPEEPAARTAFLKQHTGIYRLWGSAARPGEKWPEAEECIAKVDEAAFEALFLHRLEKIAAKDHKLNTVGGSSPFSIDLYGAEPGQLMSADLHFDNTTFPTSPFKQPEQLEASLRAVAREISESPDEVGFIFCVSWLNSVPAFLALFPDSYRASAVRFADAPPESADLTQPAEWYKVAHGSVGWGTLGAGSMMNGQFIRADGGLRSSALDEFVETGRYPMECRMCVCPAKDFLAMYGGDPKAG
eukprot:Hpha_TRINITY_DN20519_c0_g1::TRINITY_DN20519_c0_g1_i1::g.30645::m.30645